MTADRLGRPPRVPRIAVCVRRRPHSGVPPVVFQIFAHGVVGAEDVRPVNEKADDAHAVWPFGPSLVWPLPAPLGDDGLWIFAGEL